jgi:hypothetical protein
MAQRTKQKPILKSANRKSRPALLLSDSARRKSLPVPAALPAADTSQNRICWRFKHADHDGPWCFHEIDSSDLCGILRQLTSFESMTTVEAFGGSPGKDYNVEDIPNREARTRLEAIGLPDMTRISRFRLTGTARLYGFRLGNVFHVVWWDPRHEIWPSNRE